METVGLIESFQEFKEFKNIDRETMMRILEDVFFRCAGVIVPEVRIQGPFLACKNCCLLRTIFASKTGS